MIKIRLNAVRLLASALSVTFFSLAPVVHAETLQDINLLLKQKQYPQALEQVNKYLAGKPKDAQGRFLKGVVLTEMNKPDEAVKVFTKLTEDYPELPEPWNNLAVIYAQQQQYDKARASLEMAIRTHPSYATAHENLGDIYARLASQAYDKALQLDSSNTSAQNKLALIRELVTTTSRADRTKPTTATHPTEPAKQVKAPEPAPAPVTVSTLPAPAAVTTVDKPVANHAVGTMSRPTAKPATDIDADIIRAVDSWLAAWSDKDVKSYLAAYASDFKTPGGVPRSAWEAERRKRITRPGPISVRYENLHIAVDGDSATVKFRQHYKSGALKTSSNKVLHLVRYDGKWLIQQERIGN
jgi:Flp pilus assembly protein TadD/ketosteroid isomerase-like protein